jgi:hypothetical protein
MLRNQSDPQEWLCYGNAARIAYNKKVAVNCVLTGFNNCRPHEPIKIKVTLKHKRGKDFNKTVHFFVKEHEKFPMSMVIR